MKQLTPLILRFVCTLLACALLSSVPSLAEDAAPTAREADIPFAVSAYRREVTLPTGRGPLQYYAQNDPCWFDVIYEPSKADTQRTFGAGGCNPTAMAMVVANLVPEERLPDLIASSAGEKGYTICECALYGYFCRRRTEEGHRITLTRPAEFKKLLPLVIGMYACGNNKTRQHFRARANGDRGGTTWDLFDFVADSYGLWHDWTRDAQDVTRVLDEGGMAILLCSGSEQPFSGSSGHYVVVAGYDETYFYFLDPFVRDVYARDKDGIIEPVETGVKKVRREHLAQLCPSRYFLFLPAGSSFVL